MGHQHHFLSRLDRVSPLQIEIALQLYQDPEIVRRLLVYARVPEQAERVAISLAHPARGPFVIVTRGGRFVTCLGQGMSPSPHRVVTRKELDAFAASARSAPALPGNDRGDVGPRRAGAHLPGRDAKRNGRCPCGSRRRYERCCADEAA